MAISSFLFILLSLFTHSQAITEAIEIQGSKFFYPNGTQFFIKGVVYSGIHPKRPDGSWAPPQESTSDVLADARSCTRDVQYLKELGVNTITTLYVDWEQSHEDCFNTFAANDIWVIPLLSTGSATITNITEASWNVTLYDIFTEAMDELSQYNNTLAAYADFESISTVASEGAVDSEETYNTNLLPFIKAAARDTKAYVKAKDYRAIPIGYAVASSSEEELYTDQVNYLTCGDPTEAVDFIGIDDTSTNGWCGNSSYTESGYSDYTNAFSNISVPLFFARTGCNQVKPRSFTQMAEVYGQNMTQLWSGAVVYEYFQNADGYGLVNVTNGAIETTDDFSNLQDQFASVNPLGISRTAASPSRASMTCASPRSSDFGQVSSVLPPRPYQLLCSCMQQTLSCMAPSGGDLPPVLDSLYLRTLCTQHDISCDGIQASGANGNYGAYSMCDSDQQLTWLANEAYTSSGQSACSSVMSDAFYQSPTTPNGTCDAVLKQAGPQGVGTVTSYPAGTTPTADAGASGILSPSQSPSSSLSTGAKAGIGVGVVAGLAVIAAALGFYFLALKKRRKASQRREASMHQERKAELMGTEITDGEMAGFRPTMLDAKPKGTVEDDRPPQELADTSKPSA